MSGLPDYEQSDNSCYYDFVAKFWDREVPGSKVTWTKYVELTFGVRRTLIYLGPGKTIRVSSDFFSKIN